MHNDEIAVVTGANRGLGFATAEGLARDGMQVVLACRSPERGAEAEARIRASAGHERVWALTCDLAEPDSVRAFVESFGQRFDRLDVLINCAGANFRDLRLSTCGVELGWHIQFLGHYQLTRLLLPALEASAPGRVITVAGAYQRRGELRLDDLDWEQRDWSWIQAGADSQLARVIFANELADYCRKTGVTSNSVHPGAVRTGARDVLPLHLRILVDTVMAPAFVSASKGARTILRLADDPDLADVTGEYFERYRVAEPNPIALEAVARRTLWLKSAELLGMRPD